MPYRYSGNKYNAQKTPYDGMVFDSRKEAERYIVLKALEKQGEIKNLRCQVKYTITPTIRDKDGKLIEKEWFYKADFVYEKGGKEIIEDVKGYRNSASAAYRCYRHAKCALMHFYGKEVVEI